VTVTQPMDVVKTQMQTGVLDASKRHSIVSVWKKLLREEGISGITKGWTARWMASVPIAVSSKVQEEKTSLHNNNNFCEI